MRLETSRHSYRDLIVWQRADELAFQVYLVTKDFPKSETFGLVSQMRRAAVSVPANIAEGYARFSEREKKQFYNVARGSLTELDYYIGFSFRLGYLLKEAHLKAVNLENEVSRLLNGLINSLKR